MVTEVKPLQSLTKFAGMRRTLSPIVRAVNDIPNILESALKSWQLMALKFSVIKPVQPENAPSPMEVTLFGMVTEVKPLQPLNAPPPMEVTLFGMVTEVFAPGHCIKVS